MKILKNYANFILKCLYSVIFILLIRQIIDIVGNFKKSFSLLNLVGL